MSHRLRLVHLNVSSLAPTLQVEVERFKVSLEEREKNDVEEWTDAAGRSTGRYEIKFPLREPFTSPGFVTNHYVLAMSKMMLSHRCVC